MSDLGLAIRVLRVVRGMGQSDLAKECGYGNPSTISLIESGKRNPSLGSIDRLARVLGVPAHVLFLLADPGDREDEAAQRLAEAIVQAMREVRT